MGGSKGKKFFSVKGQIVNILDFVGHMISDTTTQLCFCSVKVATDNISMNKHGCVPIKLYGNYDLNFIQFSHVRKYIILLWIFSPTI